ncbi:MAG: hypothetical protein RL108_481 [Bacteroidota bacterium]|jgi:hypothetical protein
MQTMTLHETYKKDLYLWSQENARLLKEKRFDEIDLTNLIEEIEDMGRSEQRGIYNHQVNLIMHLLKWDYQNNIKSKSWRFSIRNARIAILKLIKDNPSLKDTPKNNLAEAYASARELASDETGINLKAFPIACPYTIEQILNTDWLPET